MSSANIGWLFYKDYFKNIDYSDLQNKRNEDDIKDKVQNIINQTPQIEKQNENDILGNTHFLAITTYPGLLFGSGNAHELPSIEGQAILGFHFDYTSGLPVIQGSSIKGVLRSAFKHTQYIKELLNDLQLNIEELESEIFNNNDIFFDVTIVNVDGKILGDDYITPHVDSKILGDDYITPHNDILKDPTPLRFIKVLPNITFRFDFELNDGLISKEKKLKLFQDILEDLGVGAKTNVGYGKFINFAPFKTQEEKEEEKRVLELQKIAQEKQREEEIQKVKQEKERKAEDGINSLLKCKTLPEAFKLLKDSFGKVPKPTAEQKEIIQKFYKRQNTLSKSDEKVFKKYLK